MTRVRDKRTELILLKLQQILVFVISSAGTLLPIAKGKRAPHVKNGFRH